MRAVGWEKPEVEFPYEKRGKICRGKIRQVAQREPNIEPNVDFVCVLASVVFRSGFGVRKYTSSLIILFSGINFPFSFFLILFFVSLLAAFPSCMMKFSTLVVLVAFSARLDLVARSGVGSSLPIE